MIDKPVKVTLDTGGPDTPVVHSCDTILQAEEWIADHGDREHSKAGHYMIGAPDGMMDDYVAEAEGETDTAEVDNKPALNHLARLRDLLDRAYEGAGAPMDTELASEIDAALDDIWTEQEYDNNPDLREFDEIVSQGRQAMLDWIAEGRPEATIIDPVRKMDEGKSDINVAIPLNAVDAVHFLRKRGSELIRAIGFGAASFAIPGLRHLLWKLDFVTKVPVPEDHDDDSVAYQSLLKARYTRDEFEQGVTDDQLVVIPRSDLQLVAK